jgi:hypothetical protein
MTGLEKNLCGDNLRNNALKLIGRTTAKDEMGPLGFGWAVLEFALESSFVNFGWIGDTVVAVNAFANAGMPLITKRIDSVGVAVKPNDFALLHGSGVVWIGNSPNKIAEFIEINIFWFEN